MNFNSVQYSISYMLVFTLLLVVVVVFTTTSKPRSLYLRCVLHGD